MSNIQSGILNVFSSLMKPKYVTAVSLKERQLYFVQNRVLEDLNHDKC